MKPRLFRWGMSAFVAATICYAPVSAATYNITINDAMVSHPVEVIFDENDIAPGFTVVRDINVKNRLARAAKVKLDSTIEELPGSSNLLPEMTFSINYNGQPVTTGKHMSLDLTDQELLCVAPQSDDKLELKLKFDETAGNELQSASFKVLFNFSVTDQACNASTGGSSGNGEVGNPGWILPPNTGGSILPPTKEGAFIMQTSIGVAIASLFVSLLFGFLVLFGRKKDDDKNARKRPIYTPKRRGGLEIKREKDH